MNNWEYLSLLLAVLSGAVNIPQTIRVLRLKRVDGLALTSNVAWAVSWAVWAWCSWDADAHIKAISETVGLACELSLIGLAARYGGWDAAKAISKGVLWSMPALMALGMAGATGGTVAFLVALTVYDAVYMAPQVMAATRAPSLVGLSAWSYSIRSLVGFGWIAYGWGIGVPVVGGYGYVTGPVMAYIWVRIVRDRRRASTGIVD